MLFKSDTWFLKKFEKTEPNRKFDFYGWCVSGIKNPLNIIISFKFMLSFIINFFNGIFLF